MKTLKIYRGQSTKNFTCTNGDTYDSTATLEDQFKFGPVGLWFSEYVNTDSTQGYKGGKLAKGEYYGIVGYRQPKEGAAQGKRVIKLFMPVGAMPTRYDQLTVEMMTLLSEIKNPNHNNLPVIQYCQVHDGGQSWDWSHGCLTIYRNSPHNDWERLMTLLADNEIINIILQ